MTDDRRAGDRPDHPHHPDHPDHPDREVTTPSDRVRWPDAEDWGSVGRERWDVVDRPGGDGLPAPPGDGDDDPPWPDRPEGWRHDAPDPPDAFAVPWSWTDGLFLVAWFLVAQVIVATVAFAIGVEPFEDTATLFGVVAVSHATAFVGAVIWLALRGGLSWRLMGPLRPRPARHTFVGIGIGVGGWLVVTLLLALVVLAIDRDELPTQQTIDLLAEADVTTTIVAVLAAVVLAPIVEEVIYRGVLFQALRARIGLWPGMVISAALFGLMHLDTILQADGFEPAGFIPMMGIVLLGIWLAAAFHKTGSLVVAIVGHAAFNAVAVGLAVLTMGADDLELPTAVLSPIVRVLTGG